MTADTNPRRGEDAEQEMQHGADELEARIDRLESHIDEAETKLEDRKEDAAIGEDVAGDFQDSEPGDTVGEDPVGAEGGDDQPGER